MEKDELKMTNTSSSVSVSQDTEIKTMLTENLREGRFHLSHVYLKCDGVRAPPGGSEQRIQVPVPEAADIFQISYSKGISFYLMSACEI